MYKTHSWALFLVLWSCLLVSGCQRSASEVWEDTKTGGNYVGRGFKSVAGKHGDSRQVRSQTEFAGAGEEEYIPFEEGDLYQKLAMGDPDTLQQINAYSSIPQSREAPGEPGSTIPSVEGFRDPKELSLEHIFRHVHFDTNDDVVRTEANHSIVRDAAKYLKQNENMYVFVEGHCDERGTAAYNLALGSRRSNSVRALIVKEGVHPDRIFTITYGKERPIAMGHGHEAWKVNRRAQFKLFSR